ncbi:MAG TPA: NAD(P)H-quinone oxidoreductase [Rhodospirillales bacterium]|nr:NAD(P)H-quinone oxidoreductase [Rhodospirillales bacterium]
MAESLPEEMIGIRIREPGGPEVLVPERMPTPVPGEGELLIRVAAAGVNRPDVLQRKGAYPPPPGASELPGLEVAGKVVALGPGTRRFRVGDEVCALLAGGGYAEYGTAPEPQVLPVPRGLSPIEAAALPETFFTVWTNLFERGRLAAGETVLVHGGSSGIGTTAIQLARAFGARVFTTVGNTEKARVCRELGAERAILYREEDFVEVVKEATGGRGVDVILDMVGGDYVPRNLKSLALEGRLVQIAWLGGSRVEADFARLMVKRLTWTGSTLRPRSVEEKGRIARALEEKVWPLLERGEVRPVVHRLFPLEEAAAAHALMESSTHIGKILLVTRYGEAFAGDTGRKGASSGGPSA